MTVHKTVKKNGFTLPELLAVMAIMAILAAVSSPFIRGYIRDAGNEKAKSTLRLIAVGYKNFIYEHQTRSNGLSMQGRLNTNSSECPDELSGELSSEYLIGCHYVSNISWEAYDKRYEFYVGTATQCCSEGPDDAWACMKGVAQEGDYKTGYCAWIASDGTLDDNKEEEEAGT